MLPVAASMPVLRAALNPRFGVRINRTPVRTAAQVQELLNVRPGEVIRVYLERDGQITFTDLVFR